MTPSFVLFLLAGAFILPVAYYFAVKGIVEYFDSILNWKDDLR